MRKPNTLKRLGVWALIVVAALTIPFIAKWPWTGSDYVIGGVVLFGAASIYELATRSIATTRNRIIIGVIVAFVLALVWAELAVGLFGTPFAGS